MQNNRQTKKKSCLGRLILWIIALNVLFYLAAFLMGEENYEKMSTAINSAAARVEHYITAVRAEDGPDFALGDLWAAVTGEDYSAPTTTGGKSAGGKSTGKSGSSTGTPTKAPVDVCKTRADLVRRLETCVKNKSTSITIYVSSSIYDQADRDWLSDVVREVGIDSASWTRSSRGSSYSIEFNDIEPMTSTPVSSEAELEKVLKGARSRGTVTVRPTLAFYDKLRANDWALLRDVQGRVGITDGTFSYYDKPRCEIIFECLVFAKKFKQVSSAKQALEFVEECARKGETAFAVYCTSDTLYNTLTDENSSAGTSPVSTMTSNCGIEQGNLRFSDQKRLIYTDGAVYQVGHKVARLALANQTGKLTSREKTLYNKALQMAKRCKAKSSNEYELVMNVCREIAAVGEYQLCTKTNCGSCDLDCAYGVLLAGGGECDSYTDAFYLVGTLAELDVGYQHGDASSELTGMTSDATHIWNTVTIGGSTYFLDMTWVDADHDMGLDLCYALMGRDIARYTHVWDDAYAPRKIAATSSRSLYPCYREGASFGTAKAAREFVLKQKKQGKDTAYVMLTNKGSEADGDKLVRQVINNIGLSYTSQQLGKYVFINIVFN